MKISDSKQFLNEVESFRTRISLIDDDQTKKELSAILGKLIQEVNYIDFQHSELSLTKRLPENINTSRDAISKYRKKLHSVLEVWEKIKS